jgi:hypothetical protein
MILSPTCPNCQILGALVLKLAKRLQEPRPTPGDGTFAPRYDDVFYAGVAALDRLAAGIGDDD